MIILLNKINETEAVVVTKIVKNKFENLNYDMVTDSLMVMLQSFTY